MGTVGPAGHRRTPRPCDRSRWKARDRAVTFPLMDIAADGLQALLDAGGGGTLGERMGVKLLEASPERVVGTMPVEGNTQPYGLLHGGASCVLAETLGSVGAVLHGQS